ncbi:MAG: MFS transporter [Micropepsaceae bacterium]
MPNRVTLPDIAKVASLLATAVVMLLANGLQGTLVPVRAHAEGFSSTAIALMGSCYFAGFIVGCWLAPRLTARVGQIRTFAVLGAVTAAIVLIHSLVISPILWSLMRVGIGFCAAGMFAVLEAWLNQQTANAIRGRIFTIYATLNNLALLGGQYLFTFASPGSHILFSVCAIMTMLCLLPVGLTSQTEPPRPQTSKLSVGRLYRTSPVGVVGALTVGLVSGAFWTLAPVYAQSRGMTGDGIALFMSAVIFGGAVAQWPVGRLSDFMDRRYVIGSCAVMAVLAGLVLASPAPFADPGHLWILLGGALYGATAFPIGSLTNAHLNDHARREEMSEVASTNLFVYGAAAALGPAIAAAVIHFAGMSAIFYYTASMHAAFVAFVAYRLLKRAPVASEHREPFEIEPIQPAPMHVNPGAVVD